ncbi:MAG: TetR/AcrR family transcriptional regulator [Acidimicrobiales bacterium]
MSAEAAGAPPTEAVRERRRYDSPLRRQRAAETRERIVVAGSEVLHSCPIWDWGALTVRAVATRAGINERTVYRYFASERELRDAVMQRFEAEAGVELQGLRLEDLANAMTRIFEYASAFPLVPRTPRDPTVAAANVRQRAALLAAVGPWTEACSEVDRAIAAGVLDVLWSVASYERLVVDWEIDPKEAIRGIGWAIGLVEDAIREDRGPGHAKPRD